MEQQGYYTTLCKLRRCRAGQSAGHQGSVIKYVLVLLASVIDASVYTEVQRLHRSAGQQKRQRLAILSAILSLLILGVTTWFEVEAVNALTDTSLDRSSERWILALVQIILWGICLLATFAILFYLRVRRPTATSIYALSLALIVSLLHIVLSIINFSLIGAWRKAIHNQCEAWRLDIVWMHRGTCTDQQTSLTDFLVAAGIRLLVVVLVAVRVFSYLLLTYFERTDRFNKGILGSSS